jgi:hypothetical protein
MEFCNLSKMMQWELVIRCLGKWNTMRSSWCSSHPDFFHDLVRQLPGQSSEARPRARARDETQHVRNGGKDCADC